MANIYIYICVCVFIVYNTYHNIYISYIIYYDMLNYQRVGKFDLGNDHLQCCYGSSRCFPFSGPFSAHFLWQFCSSFSGENIVDAPLHVIFVGQPLGNSGHVRMCCDVLSCTAIIAHHCARKVMFLAHLKLDKCAHHVHNNITKMKSGSIGPSAKTFFPPWSPTSSSTSKQSTTFSPRLQQPLPVSPAGTETSQKM